MDKAEELVLYRRCLWFMAGLDDPRTAARFDGGMRVLSPQPDDTVSIIRNRAWDAIALVESGGADTVDEDDWKAIEIEEKIHLFDHSAGERAAAKSGKVVLVSLGVLAVTAYAVLSDETRALAGLVIAGSLVAILASSLGGWQGRKKAKRAAAPLHRASDALRKQRFKFRY